MITLFIIIMDAQSISQYLEVKKGEYSLLSGRRVMDSLLLKEHVEIEDLKNMIFQKRMDYFVLASCLKQSMLNESGHKQLKNTLYKNLVWKMTRRGLLPKNTIRHAART